MYRKLFLLVGVVCTLFVPAVTGRGAEGLTLTGQPVPALRTAVPTPSRPAAAVQTPAATKRFDVTVADVDDALHASWFGVYVNQKKIGFLHEAIEKVTENGQTFYRTCQRAQMKLKALGKHSEANIDQTFVFAAQAPFALVKGEYTSTDGHSTKRISLTATDNGFEATTAVGKVTTKSTLGALNFTLADIVSQTMWLKTRPATGDSLTVTDFDFGDLYLGTLSLKVLGTKDVVVNGGKVAVTEVEKIEAHAVASSVSLIRYDTNALAVSGLMVGMFEIRRESEADAKKTEVSEDFIFANMVKVDRPLGDHTKVKGITLKGKGKINGLLPDTALQTVSQQGDDYYLLKIGKHHGTKVKATDREIEEALKETAAYPIRDANVIELAKKAVGDAKTDREKMERLCKFVHQYIKYDIVLLPKVHDIIEQKTGDCKSYALLFTCLAQAVGLPVRECNGYGYMGDNVKGFGGHAWNEVVIDGHWHFVDATTGDTDLPPLYICLGASRQGVQNMTQSMGKLSFEVIDVELVQ